MYWLVIIISILLGGSIGGGAWKYLHNKAQTQRQSVYTRNQALTLKERIQQETERLEQKCSGLAASDEVDIRRKIQTALEVHLTRKTLNFLCKNVNIWGSGRGFLELEEALGRAEGLELDQATAAFTEMKALVLQAALKYRTLSEKINRALTSQSQEGTNSFTDQSLQEQLNEALDGQLEAAMRPIKRHYENYMSAADYSIQRAQHSSSRLVNRLTAVANNFNRAAEIHQQGLQTVSIAFETRASALGEVLQKVEENKTLKQEAIQINQQKRNQERNLESELSTLNETRLENEDEIEHIRDINSQLRDQLQGEQRRISVCSDNYINQALRIQAEQERLRRDLQRDITSSRNRKNELEEKFRSYGEINERLSNLTEYCRSIRLFDEN
jgi:hypothetical protein